MEDKKRANCPLYAKRMLSQKLKGRETPGTGHLQCQANSQYFLI